MRQRTATRVHVRPRTSTRVHVRSVNEALDSKCQEQQLIKFLSEVEVRVRTLIRPYL